jgi:hypothetical protein
MDTQTVPSLIPDGIYDDESLHAVLGVSAQVLAHARRQGQLRHARKGKRVLYLGQWVLEWLMAEERQPREVERGC